MHAALAAMILASLASDEPVKLSLVSDGAMSKIGFYAPQRVKLSADKPASVTKVPDGVTAPMYGVIEFKSEPAKSVAILVDEPDGKPARLFIDANGNGDLTDDAATKWDGRKQGEFTMYNGSAKLNIGSAAAPYEIALGMYRFDKNDPQRAALKDTLLYYRDYAVEGEIKLGDKSYKMMLDDSGATGDFRGKALADAADEKASSGVTLMIDVNGNGKFDRRGETFDIRKPFNIGGVTYELKDVAANGLSMKVAKSDKTVAEIPLAPDHSVGKKITAFDAKATDGKDVHFPADYKGKIVMIDFWATWCGPCMNEVPGLVKVYNKYHDQGFEVLGISLDNEKTVEKLEPVTKDKGMTWRQVCDAKGWNAAIAKMYVVEGIPACWLVDGDTGAIIATENQLRGEKLEATIQKALEELKKRKG